MNIFADFAERVNSVVKGLDLAADAPELDLRRVTVEPPRDAAHGDLATNAAMVLAKQLKMKPRDLAEKIAEGLRADSEVDAVDIAGPGFINIRVNKVIWERVLADVVAKGNAFGSGSRGAGLKVNVEYVSANPTGPMHVGHTRGAVVGDALASLLQFAGYDVTREYVINDAGSQIDTLAKSAFLRYREALGEDIGQIHEGYYPGEYLIPVGKALAEEHGERLKDMGEGERHAMLKGYAVDKMMDLIREDLSALNVKHDVFFSEKTMHGQGNAIDLTLDALRQRDLVYTGTLPPPKGEVSDDWEDREQTLFRSSNYGDDSDRALVKSDGSYTYFAADVAYMRDKIERGFKEIIFVLGADHGGYVKRLEAIGNAISGGDVDVIVRLCQLVKLFKGGAEFKMSKRSGNFITLRDVVDEVGVDAVRFMMLYRKNDAQLDFDFDKVKEQSKDNPVFYVQYGHARCHSVLRQAAGELDWFSNTAEELQSADFAQLEDEGELALIAKMAQWPRIVDGASENHEPHRIAFYLYELANALHSHWSRGKEKPQLRFINDKTPELTKARLALVYAVSQVIASGLNVLGVTAPNEMR
ncbi:MULTISPECIES: arginine--tRNA ligase [unclassified Pseudovibrio]|uniref:arginine--tRNA ligase n=1 Tax=unclassified Pseudovibrio TaxID=2627060 RepID=UPI0007AE733E|nr:MULTISPECIES: arginine--tRNA ligase [unclassified Pseudovibrio]KZK98527.1 Arginine--tRNA ligase [Pseudovibrio sp. W74]KZL08373.1 Arginine--tRNA ligase [Pseudovibrio sp. Ad14]